MLRRLAFAIPLSLAPGMTWAQGPCYLCYTPPSSAGGGTWGSITGTLSAQTDLNDALTVRPTITASASYPSGACTPGNLWRVTGVNYLFQCGPNAIWDYSRRNTTGNVFYFHGAWTDSTNNEGMSITATPGQDTQFQNFTDGTGTDNIGFNFIPAGTGTFKVGTTLFVVGSTAVTSTVPILIPNGTEAGPAFALSSASSTGFYKSGFSRLTLAHVGNTYIAFGDALFIGANSYLSFTTGNAGATSGDLFFMRDGAANIQIGLDAATATAQTISAADSTGAGIAGASLTLSGGTGGAGGLQGNVIIDSGSNLVVTKSMQGSTPKALTETSATTFATVAIPQTAGANFAAGKIIYTIYETDGTDTTTIQGEAQFNCANKAGTEGCAAIADVQTAAYSTSGTDTLVCTITAVTGLVDLIGLAANCTDAGTMTQTTLNILARFDMPQPNTLTFP